MKWIKKNLSSIILVLIFIIGLTGGLLLLASALFLTAWNLYEGEKAGDASDKVVERLTYEI